MDLVSVLWLEIQIKMRLHSNCNQVDIQMDLVSVLWLAIQTRMRLHQIVISRHSDGFRQCIAT